jgi:hypothetical protein
MANRYLAILRGAAENGNKNPSGRCDKSDGSDKSPPSVASVSSVATVRGTSVASVAPFARTFEALEGRCPDYVPIADWHRAVEDGRRFLIRWAEQAERLGWTASDLFGLHQPPAKPHPSYSRLSRYDATGLIWLLRGRPVTVLTEATAAIENPSGAITIYRKHNKPPLGPVGDSLDDFQMSNGK